MEDVFHMRDIMTLMLQVRLQLKGNQDNIKTM